MDISTGEGFKKGSHKKERIGKVSCLSREHKNYIYLRMRVHGVFSCISNDVYAEIIDFAFL